jgi:hypothetical protein
LPACATVQGFLSEWGPSHDVIDSHLTAAKPPPGRRRIRAARAEAEAAEGGASGRDGEPPERDGEPPAPTEPPTPD